jgi:hypothetical protein
VLYERDLLHDAPALDAFPQRRRVSNASTLQASVGGLMHQRAGYGYLIDASHVPGIKHEGTKVMPVFSRRSRRGTEHHSLDIAAKAGKASGISCTYELQRCSDLRHLGRPFFVESHIDDGDSFERTSTRKQQSDMQCREPHRNT